MKAGTQTCSILCTRDVELRAAVVEEVAIRAVVQEITPIGDICIVEVADESGVGIIW